MRILFALICLLGSSLCYDIHVSPDGLDTNSGNISSPLASLAGSRLLIKTLKAASQLPNETINVIFSSGYYFFNQTVAFDVQDSGTATQPIVYQSAPGAEVHFVGGKNFPLSSFILVSDKDPFYSRLHPNAKGKAMFLNLTAVNVDPGTLNIRGFGAPSNSNPSALEVFYSSRAFQLARYPNSPPKMTLTAGWLKTGTGSENLTVAFQFNASTTSLYNQETDPWALGFWGYDWAELYVPITLNTAANTFNLNRTNYPLSAGHNFYFLNLFSEMDIEGEYYIDRQNNLLFIYPFADLESDSIIQLSTINSFVVLNNVAYVTFENIFFEVCRGVAITVNNGNNVVLNSLQVMNTGLNGLTVSGGKNHVVSNSKIFNNADGAISVYGGTRATLTPANHTIINCDITNFNRWRRTYTPGVSVSGVGINVLNNNIYYAPHVLILWGGNNLVFSYNRLSEGVLESVDAGAVYSGRDWTLRGNVISYNYFRDIPQSAIYFDDQFSSATVIHNVFVGIYRAILLGGGRDISVTNNLFVNCTMNFYMDARGLGICGPSNNETMYNNLYAVPFKTSPWSDAYPKLAAIESDTPHSPNGNSFNQNVQFGGIINLCNNATLFPLLSQPDNQRYANFSSSDFVNEDQEDFRLVPSHPALSAGTFTNVVPIAEVGVQGIAGPVVIIPTPTPVTPTPTPVVTPTPGVTPTPTPSVVSTPTPMGPQPEPEPEPQPGSEPVPEPEPTAEETNSTAPINNPGVQAAIAISILIALVIIAVAVILILKSADQIDHV